MTWQNRQRGKSKKGGKLKKHGDGKVLPVLCGIIRPYDCPSDVRCSLKLNHTGQHLGYGPHGEPCLWTQGPGRCPSTPPPTKWSAQQCDQLAGHVGAHWFHDGMTKNEWSVDHMDWCGMDTDHSGNCAPRMDDDGTRPEKPPVDTDGRGNEIRHADVWDDETVPYVLADDEDYSLEAAIDYFTDTCSVVDEAHAVFCDLSYPHENEWHSGTDGVRRYSWPTVYRVPGHDYQPDGTHYMWTCGECIRDYYAGLQDQLDAIWASTGGNVGPWHSYPERVVLPTLPEPLPWDGSHTADEVLTNWHERGECGGSCRLCLNLANIKAAMPVGEHCYVPGADTVPCGESLSETTQEGTEALKRQALTDTVREAIVALSTLLEEIA